MPIYDGKQRIQEYKKIEIAENTRVLNREFYSSQYWQQYRQLQEQLHLTDDLLVEINAQIDQYNKLIEMYKIEIEKGLVRFTDFLSAINNYTNAQNNLAVARMNRMQIINQLNYLK
jgi:outer membrane protein TolC